MSKSRMIIETARNLRAKILNEQAKEPRGVRADATNSARNTLGKPFDVNDIYHTTLRDAFHNSITRGNEATRRSVDRLIQRHDIEHNGTFKGKQEAVIAWVKKNHGKNNNED